MNTVLKITLSTLLLTATASADRFYLGTEEAAEKQSEGSPAAIEGVLLREENDRYVIRTVGGIIQLPKSQVWKVESTDLTEEAIAREEDDRKEENIRANQLRRAVIAASRERVEEIRADYAAARAADAEVREASADVGYEGVDVLVPGPVGYDPVLDIYRGSSIQFEIAQTIQNQIGSEIRRVIRPQLKEIRSELRKTLGNR